MIAPVDVTNIRIETERLILRAWRKEDLEDFYEYARVDGVGQMAGWLPHKDLEESRFVLGLFIEGKKTFAIELKENGKVIGSLGLEERDVDLPVPDSSMGREIGYAIGKPYWGRGLMPEAVQAVIGYCFKELNFDWLTCGHFIRNHQSRRVVEKCGFQHLKDVVHQTRFGTEEPTRLYLMENPGNIIRSMSAPVDAAGMRIETERLQLRPVNPGDLSDIHEICTMPEVAEMAGWTPSENVDMSVKRMLEYMDDNETLAIVLKENQKMIGTVSLQKRFWNMYPIDLALKGRELGFDLNQNYWGRGLMPEAVQAVCEYCFRELNYDFITAGHFLRNRRSARVMEKCGFRFLVESLHELPTGAREQIRTFIRYNTNKEN